jgi:hypothetical protein
MIAACWGSFRRRKALPVGQALFQRHQSKQVVGRLGLVLDGTFSFGAA